MIDLKKVKLPDTIEVEGSFYRIKTDFREWLLFGELINSPTVSYSDIVFIFRDIPDNLEKALPVLMEFYAPKSELPRSTGKGSTEIVLDYKLDADLIYSAFIQVYNIDLMATDIHGHIIPLHWHKFLALMSGLTNTKLNEVMKIRSYEGDPKDTSDYNKQMNSLKRAWRLPQNLKPTPAQERFTELLKKP